MPHLLATGGVMINTSSVHALMGFRQHGAYDASKGTISAMTRTRAVEYGPTIRVTAMLPGGIMTAAWAHTTPEYQEAFARQTVAGRLGRPEEIAASLCFWPPTTPRTSRGPTWSSMAAGALPRSREGRVASE
jgi:NAD(P)-dependent dehydrogenase (short-subunit alcohol dehydrogenase family)